MAHLPFIGRLHLFEYFALGISFALLFLETFIRTVTLFLPGPVIRFCYRVSRRAFNALSSPYSRRARQRKKAVSSPIAQAHDFVELCELYGYSAEEHIVQTRDGYLLGVHRLGWRQGEEEVPVNSGPGSVQKKVVYLHHGLLMNSEVWVCLTEKERCLPFMLVEQGYDVWLGNNRGNKYSKKSLNHAPTQDAFWDFSMDQFAFHDIPDTIDYILEATKQPSLSYVGFSQGTAQAFATLSIHPSLNEKVDVFVALAPAMAPPGIASGVVSSLVKSNPQVLFLAFGRRAMLGSATMWQALLYPAIFTWFIDKSLAFLFSWKTKNITPHQKLAAYPHLYSFTSVKSVVHWFQIIRNGTFQMYDDEVSTPLAVGNGSKYYKVAKFPTRNIKTPIVLVYGGSDSLVDINLMLKELPKHTIAKGIKKYEHLDLLWASDVDKLVFPHVFDALETFALPDRTKQAALGWTRVQRGIMDRANLNSSHDSNSSSLPPRYSDDEMKRAAVTKDIVTPDQAFDFQLADRSSLVDEQLDETADEDEYDAEDSGPERFALTPQRGDDSRAVRSSPPTATTATSSAFSSPNTEQKRRASLLPRPKRSAEGRSLRPAQVNTQTSTTRNTIPESWWQSTADSTAEDFSSQSRSTQIDREHDSGTATPNTTLATSVSPSRHRVASPRPASSSDGRSPQRAMFAHEHHRRSSDASNISDRGIGFVASKGSPVTGEVARKSVGAEGKKSPLGFGDERKAKKARKR